MSPGPPGQEGHSLLGGAALRTQSPGAILWGRMRAELDQRKWAPRRCDWCPRPRSQAHRPRQPPESMPSTFQSLYSPAQPSVILGLTFSFSSENKTLCFLILKVTSVYQGNYPVWRVILSYDKGRFSPCFPLWPFYGEHFPWCPCPTLPPSSLYFLPPHLKSYLQVPLAGICVLRLSKPRCHC